MSSETARISSQESFQYTWKGGAAGGLIGGVAMGIILHAGANMMPLIGTLYGWPTAVGGWVAHLVNSVVLGLLFALIVSHPLLRNQTSTIVGCIISGVLYAAAIGLVTGGIMFPITLNLIGSSVLPESIFPLPGVLGDLLVVFSVGVAHMVYGVLLGGTYGAIHNAPIVERENLQ